MPFYELSLVLKVLPRLEQAAILKRVGQLLIEAGASVQRLENHGTRDLPYRFRVRDVHYFKGSYYVYSFQSGKKVFGEISDDCSRDVDILRHYVCEIFNDLPADCTLHEEMKPPAERKSVLDLLEISKMNKERTKPVYRQHKTYEWFNIYM